MNSISALKLLPMVKNISVILFFIVVPAQAELIDRGGGLIYDDVQDLTWLQDANYPVTSGHSVDGKFQSHAARQWAADLSYYDSVRDVWWRDWRLPNMDINSDIISAVCPLVPEEECLADNEFGYLTHYYGIQASNKNYPSN